MGYCVFEKGRENKTKQTEFPCDQCEYKTNQSNNLKQHKKTRHDPSKPKKSQYLCCDKCGYTAQRNHCVKKHIENLR